MVKRRKNKQKFPIKEAEPAKLPGCAPRNDAPKDTLARLPPEVLHMIGEVIQSPKTLRSLVGTCRAFKDIFEPFLYVTRTYNLQKLNPARPRYIELPPGLVHVKEFKVLLYEFMEGIERKGIRYDPKTMNDKYSRYLARLIGQTPNLQSFSWYDQSFEGDFSTALILKNKTLLKALKAAPKLTSLSVTFETVIDDDDFPDSFNCSIPLMGFKNLTSLELFNLFGYHFELVKDIAALLARSPALKTLGLGLQCHAQWDILPEAIVIPGKGNFLEKLCLSYQEFSESPLSLDTLRLGWGMCVFDPTSPGVDNYLELLFRPADLITLHIHNGYVKLGSPYAATRRMPTEWELLKDCTSLRCLGITRLDAPERDWLNDVAINVKEIILADRHGMVSGAAQKTFASLNHSLSVLVTAEKDYPYNQDSESDSDDSELDSDDSESDSGVSSNSSISEYSEPHVMRLDEITPSPPGNRVIPLSVSRRVATVLDHLKDGGRNLTHLALSLDLDVQWEHFTTQLAHLENLTHLRVMRRTWKCGPWPDKENSLWRGVHKPKDVARCYVQLLKTICPPLKYVHFQDWAWQIVVKHDTSKGTKNKDSSRYETVELDWEELMRIPIFAQDPVGTQVGLPGNDLTPHSELSEAQWTEWQKRDQIINERYTEWRGDHPDSDGDDFIDMMRASNWQ